MFLFDYYKEYNIPVFYGNLLLDSQYNEYICSKIVSALSSKKRNFIINPVLALAYDLFLKLITNNSEIQLILTELSKLPKINKLSSVDDIQLKLSNFTNFTNLLNKYYSPRIYIFQLISFIFQKFTTIFTIKQLINKLYKNKQLKKIKLIELYNNFNSNIHIPKLEHVVNTTNKF